MTSCKFNLSASRVKCPCFSLMENPQAIIVRKWFNNLPDMHWASGKCKHDDNVYDECWMMKTVAAKRGNYFSVVLLLVDFCVSSHFPHFSVKAYEMKRSQMKVCQFSGSTKMLDSCQKIKQGVYLLMCTCRKITFLWGLLFVGTDSYDVYGIHGQRHMDVFGKYKRHTAPSAKWGRGREDVWERGKERRRHIHTHTHGNLQINFR